VELAQADGLELPDWVEGDPPFGTDDELVGTYVDWHASRGGEVCRPRRAREPGRQRLLPRHGAELFGAIFAIEAFVRAKDSTGAPLPEDDLSAGLR